MERVGSLIERLTEQYGQHADASQLMVTAQMLLAELQQEKKPENASKKVAVILPSGHTNKTVTVNGDYAMPKQEIRQEPKKAEPVLVEVPVEKEPVIIKKEEPKERETVKENNYRAWAYDPVREVPTLAHQSKEAFDLNEVIGVQEESLNERLRVEKIELATVLKETPIRDLKKAIGINDRYLFVNDLFRGDETMYERSIKTINSFNILAEAEYWIQRELKVKLGWNDDTETVRLFDQLVRRRFS